MGKIEANASGIWAITWNHATGTRGNGHRVWSPTIDCGGIIPLSPAVVKPSGQGNVTIATRPAASGFYPPKPIGLRAKRPSGSGNRGTGNKRIDHSVGPKSIWDYDQPVLPPSVRLGKPHIQPRSTLSRRTRTRAGTESDRSWQHRGDTRPSTAAETAGTSW